MPDVHAGKGCTIGTTMTITDKVVPNIVGVDTLDECPMVYKPMDEIVGQITDTVKIESVIRPIYNFKASEFSGRRKGR